ncbi:MAG: lipoprotein-releasing ABC transporter permease subunit [Pseudohongiellaceae bacterium]
MRNPDSFSFAVRVAARYVSMGKRSQLVSFMSAISIFGLALGIMMLITVLSVMNGFDREVRENVLGIIPHLNVATDELYSAENWDEIEQLLLAHPSVRATAPLIERTGVIARGDFSQGVLVNGVDAQREADFSRLSRFMLDGSLSALAAERWGVVLGSTLAQQLDVGLGDQVDLFSLHVSINPLTPLPSFRAFTVTGIYRVGTQELDRNLAIINIDAARILFRLRSPYTSMRVQLGDVLQANQVRRDLLGQLPGEMTVTSWTQLFGSIYENIRFSRTIVGLMLWLLIAVAAFNLVVSLIMIVRDKQGDIAILRTLGAHPGTINRIFMLQGLMVGVAGIAIGLVLGVAASLWVGDLARLIESVWDVQILNAEVYPIDFLPSQILLSDLLSVAAGVLVLSLLATIYPARRAAAIQPAEALRLE